MSLCFSKIQIGFTFLVPVPAHRGSPGQRAIKRVCVCVCVSLCYSQFRRRTWLQKLRTVFLTSSGNPSSAVTSLNHAIVCAIMMGCRTTQSLKCPAVYSLYCCLDVHDYYNDLCLINSVIRLLFRTRAMASLRSAARRCGMNKLLMNVSSSCWRNIGTLNRPLLKSYKMKMVR